MKPETSAWLTLLIFFVLFCSLVAIAGYYGWYYYSTATRPVFGTLLTVHAPAGVELRDQTVNIPRPLVPSGPQEELSEGHRVSARPAAGYGPVASVTLPNQTQIDLFAHPIGADLTLERYREQRWSGHQHEIVFRQHAGYVRYDLAPAQQGEQISYSVELANGARVVMEPGGSYSVGVPRDASGNFWSSLVPVINSRTQAEVAVRSTKTAIVESGGERVIVRQGEKVVVTTEGELGRPTAAGWQLIADGNFGQFERQDRYSSASRTWRVISSPGAQDLTDQEKNGRFLVSQSCPPQTPVHCPDRQVPIGQFRRTGGQTRNYITGVEQVLDVDISEYTQLRFSAWARVLEQSVRNSGEGGTECPVFVTFIFKESSPTDRQQERHLCAYTPDDPNAPRQTSGEVTYWPVPIYDWYQIQVDLRADALLRNARYIQSIQIQARGHDYVSEIYGVSLIGVQ